MLKKLLKIRISRGKHLLIIDYNNLWIINYNNILLGSVLWDYPFNIFIHGVLNDRKKLQYLHIFLEGTGDIYSGQYE
jgi:hypothetical protein